MTLSDVLCILTHILTSKITRIWIYSLLGLMVANFQSGVIVEERGFEIVYSDPVDATLFAVQLDPVQVDHGGEDGELNIALKYTQARKTSAKYNNMYLKHEKMNL